MRSSTQQITSDPITIHLASQSLIKKNATQLAFQKMLGSLTTNIVLHNSPSGVNNQPIGYDETERGAANRMKSIEDNTLDLNNSIMVSIENGIRYAEEEKTYYDFVHVIVKKDGKAFSHTEDCCKVPTEIIHALSTETWGDVAKRMGIAKQSDNPHQEACFGGISRTDLLTRALCKAIDKLIKSNQFNISRLVNINDDKTKNKYAKRGVLFTTQKERTLGKPIDLYNQGCPHQIWNTNPLKVMRNTFKVFSTGDAFSVLSPDIETNGANVNIHVGIEHANYSPLVLLQEALQLCRTVYEHDAGKITIALPEQFHPILYADDFNLLLMRLFKASGANKIYYYDKNYTGILDETNRNAIIPFVCQPEDNQTFDNKLSLDAGVMRLMRKSYFNRALSKFDINHSNTFEKIISNGTPSEIIIPDNNTPSHVLLCCSANKPLADKIAASLRLHGEMVTLYQTKGKGDQALIPDDAEICGATVTIIQSTRPSPDNIEEAREYEINGASSYFFEAAMIARQAHLRGATKINLINPYQYNARSDKAEDNPKGKTGAYVQHNGMLLAASGVNHVITAECHDVHTLSGSYTGKKIQGSAVPALSVMSANIVTDWLNDTNHTKLGQLRLVAPDAGATKRTKELTQQLQVILGKQLCATSIAGEKHRDSHEDDSALISSLNSGTIGINANDKYVITDDETATGTTLCQAITNLKKNGANDISVIVAHNNMPLDWLLRQLCLARFLYLGVNDLHFSDTQEMGTLAKNYEDLVHTYSHKSALPSSDIENQILAWFKKNISADFSDKSNEHFNQEFAKFKSSLNQFQSRITVHTLASEFAHHVMTKHLQNEASLSAGNQGVYASGMGSLLFFNNHSNRPNYEKDSVERGLAVVEPHI